MALENSLIYGVGALLVLYIVYKIFFRQVEQSVPQNEYEKLYNKVLTSEEYKVKGQHGK